MTSCWPGDTSKNGHQAPRAILETQKEFPGVSQARLPGNPNAAVWKDQHWGSVPILGVY